MGRGTFFVGVPSGAPDVAKSIAGDYPCAEGDSDFPQVGIVEQMIR